MFLIVDRPEWMSWQRSWHNLIGDLRSDKELWSDKAQIGTLPEKLGYTLYSIRMFICLFDIF